ncbi:E3 ubiquitin protein ligase listerin [Tanacetum coccineum]
MGRQKGESARTKARPSSSSLAASLLPAGGLSVGFGGYVGSSRLDPSTTSTSADSPSTVLEVDGELAQHLKRLSRKDPTTKLKALTTLSTQLSEKSAKEVSLLIPQWAFEYKKLLQDYNRDIRRATHDTMATLVSTAGRDLAPHLKSLMGPWWFSQFDPVYEVSQAAKRSLQAAFPAQDKRLDALMLCTDEVFMYLGENLKLTPQSMSEKAVALDELQEMHQQVISSSLLALATLLDILTSDKHGSENLSSEPKHALKAKTTAISHAEKLLSAHKCFVDFLKSNSSAIRSAAYTLVRSCVENISHAFDEANIKIVAPAILGAFQEKDPTCHSSMWEAVLLFSKRFPESRTWPFFCLVGPMLSKSFQLMQTIDSLNGIKFMVVAVSMFGPLKFIQEVVRGQIEPSSQSEEKNQDLNTRQFLKYYKDTFVPWCLQANSCSSMARLDLLLSLLNEECFSEQLDKESIKKKLDMRHWHHERLDSTVLSIARSLPPFGSSDARFVRKDLIFILAAIGGITEDQTNLVSENTSVFVFEEIFYKLLSFIGTSNFTWVRGAYTILNSEEHITIDGCESSSVLEMANFALEVLDGSLYRLNTLTNNPSLLPRVLAALFMIDWEHSTLAVLDDESNNEAYAEVMDRSNFCRSVHSFRRKINKFIIALSQDSRRTLRNIMVQAIRCVVFSEDKLEIDEAASLASIYAMDVLDSLCLGPVEEQTMFDELLNKGDSWPFWVVPDINDGQRSATLNVKTTSIDTGVVPNVGCLVDKLNIGTWDYVRVHRGIPSAHEDPSKKVSTSCSYYPRVWLAAEMLCTWKWQGGSAINSFLPSFIEYTRKQDSSSSDNLLDPVVKVLLDSALVQGAASKMIFSSIYPALHDELESIEEVFLRALVGVLRTLFEDNIWGRDKALVIFNLLVDRLFVGEAVNSNCLKIFPVVMSALISPLSCQVDDSGYEKPNSSEQNQIHDVIEGWLQRVLSFPPLNTWNSGEDIEDWFQLIVSCYPFRPTKRMQQFKPQRHISHLEHAHLLELLRKQRLGPTTINKLPIVQTLLSKLTVIVVGYCWTDLNQEDWDFILYNTRRWIESTVVLMEDVAESVNETITSGATSDIHETLQHTLSAIDSSPFKLARNALICFSLFCGLVRQESVKSENGNENKKDLNLLRPEKWEFVTEKIQEGVLRLLFSTGATEAIAGSYSSMASSIISSSRIDECYFWELVASSAVKSSSIVRERAIISFEIWGLSKGAVSSLYAILFSSKPVACLQYAAYVILSSESISESAFVTEQTSSSLRENDIDGNNSFVLKEEISAFLNKSPEEVLYLDLVAPDRVNVFVAWSLLISHLVSSPSSSPTKQKLIQHIQQGMQKQKSLHYRQSVYFAVVRITWYWFSGDGHFCVFHKTMVSKPPLLSHRMDQIKNANLSDENFSVSVSKSVNEVVATYTKEETGMDLVVRLPLSYSLKPVDVECTRSLGITEVKQRKWLLSMISFIRNQNGALAEAIRIWKNNIDKEFEGVEECPICYSVIHPTYHTLPKLACKTCKHKFHSGCLYKWFTTSNKSNCPLCQSPWRSQ